MLPLLIAALPSLAQETITLEENFNDWAPGHDGTPDWLPQTPGWSAHDGGYGFDDSRRRGTASWLKTPVFADLDLSVRFRIAEEGKGVRAAGIAFRSQNSADQYYVHIDSGNSQVILLCSTRAKSWNELKRVRKVAIARDQWHEAKVLAEGSKLEFYLDGKQIISLENSTYRAGIIGLRVGQGRILYDDLRITGTRGKLAKEWEFLAQSKVSDDIDRPMLKDAERVVAVRGGGYFPVLIKLRDGSLGAVVRGGAPHIGIKGRLDWVRSTDGGKTWSEPVVIADSKWDDRNPALGQMPNGTIVCAYAEAQTYNAEGEWDTSAGQYVLFYKLSTDNGITWGEKKPLYNGPIYGGSPYGQICLLEDGTALMSLYGSRMKDDWDGKPTVPQGSSRLVGVLRSTDNGETWGEFSLVSLGQHNETAVLQLGGDHILAAARRGNGGLDVMESHDAGRTWGDPRPATQPGQHPAGLCKLADGDILLVWGNRRDPMGAGCTLSSDSGATWRYDERVVLGWTSLGGDCGYPSVVQLDDGTIVVMYYSVGTQDMGPDQLAIVVRFTPDQLHRAMSQ